MLEQADQKEGYRVFVRVVSGLIITICLLFSAGFYLVVGITQTYAPEASNFRELTYIFLLLFVVVYLIIAMVRGKFVWFLNRRFGIGNALAGVLVLSILMAVAAPVVRVFVSDASARKTVLTELDHGAIRDAGRAFLLENANLADWTKIEREQLPAEIAETDPTQVRIVQGNLEVRYGDRLGPFGFVIGHSSRPVSYGEWLAEGIVYFEAP